LPKELLDLQILQLLSRLGDEQWVFCGKRADERRVDREIVVRRMARAAGAPVAIEGLLEEKLAAFFDQRSLFSGLLCADLATVRTVQVAIVASHRRLDPVWPGRLGRRPRTIRTRVMMFRWQITSRTRPRLHAWRMNVSL
jgi:hypothetical protein